MEVLHLFVLQRTKFFSKLIFIEECLFLFRNSTVGKLCCTGKDPPYLADWINWTEIKREPFGQALYLERGGRQTKKASQGLLMERGHLQMYFTLLFRLESWTESFNGAF